MCASGSACRRGLTGMRSMSLRMRASTASSLPMSSRPLAGLQTLYVADELDSRLARIAADARLAEQETGLSTLFLAFGFLRWYERTDSETVNFAPLLLLPVELKRRMEGRRAIYTVRAVAEFPEINLSLREWLARASPSRKLPEFDDESDGIASYFKGVEQTIAGL